MNEGANDWLGQKVIVVDYHSHHVYIFPRAPFSRLERQISAFCETLHLGVAGNP